MRKSRRAITAGVLIATILSFAAMPIASADPEPNDQAYDMPVRAWVGEPGPEIDQVATLMEGLLEAHPDVFTGLAFSADYSTLEVYHDREDTVVAERLIGQAVDRNKASMLELHGVSRSVNEFLELQQKAARVLTESGVAWTSIDIDFLNDGLNVGVPSSKVSDRASSLLSPNTLNALDINRIVVEPVRPQLDSAQTDALKFTMGSELIGTDTNSLCSAAYPITLPNGTVGVITAGHCGNNTFIHQGPTLPYIVGATYTTTASGSGSTYGDWQVISNNGAVRNPQGWQVIGSDPNQVERFIYTAIDPVNGLDSDKSQIVNMRFTALPLGRTLCGSGRTSGFSCRYKINAVNQLVGFAGGKNYAHITETFSDQNLDAIPDCGKLTGGDSGGAIWYAPSTGGAVGYAIHTGGASDASCPLDANAQRGSKFFFHTQTSGIRALYPTAIIGGFLNGSGV